MNSSKPTNAALNTKVPSKISEYFGKFKGWIGGDNSFTVLLIILTVLIFIMVVIYITFKIRASNLEGKRLVESPIKLDTMTSPLEISNSNIPVPSVGLEYSYNMWLYIENLEQSSAGANPTQHKLLFYRGDPATVENANPLVMLDGVNSKMYIVFKTTNSTLKSDKPKEYENDLKKVVEYNCFNSKSARTCSFTSAENRHVIITIDYIPIQRWVNIAFSVDNKIITVYVDGEIYSVKSVDEYRSLKHLENNLVLSNSTGTIYVGKNPNVGNGNTVSGYLSRLEFYNYAVSVNDVRNMYSSGPFKKSWLSYVGMNQYGVRNPIYRIDQQ